MADNHEDCVNNSLSTFFICYETVNIALSAAFIAIFSFRFHRLKCLNAGVKYESKEWFIFRVLPTVASNPVDNLYNLERSGA